MTLPVQLVSVIAPCRNEREHVAAFCKAVARQNLPPGVEMEVLIADGQSEDNTRQQLAALCAADPRFVMVDNPQRIVSTGLNRCIERARGDVIVRMDLHTVYANDYIAQCLDALRRTDAANVGGPWRAEGEGPMGEAIAAAFQSRWVSGGARSRDLAYEGPVDTVYLGCWPRSTFERHGRFDEDLVRNQDDEHNLRLVRAGARVWQSAAIRSSYTPRNTLGQLFRQQRQYGYWKPFVMRKHGGAASLRQWVPALFVLALALALVGSIVWEPALPMLAALIGAYALYVAGATASIVAGQPGRRGALAWRVPAVIATMHLGYGVGTWRGWADVLLRGAPSPAFGTLTR